MPAPQASVIWEPRDDTSVVLLEPSPSLLADENEASLPVEGPVVSEAELSHAFHDLGDGQRLQIVYSKVLKAPVVAVVPLTREGFDRLEAIHRLLASLHGRTVPPDSRITPQQKARLRRMLQADDGRRSGASQRDIAAVIFGMSSIRRDEWQSASQRYAVMALLRDAQAMVEGGYRRLLRHRHRG